jgi:Domain of unknown function (DUF4360)
LAVSFYDSRIQFTIFNQLLENFMIKFLTIAFICSTVFLMPAQAQKKGPIATAGGFTYTGTGCPSGTASTMFNSSGSNLNVHFTSFAVSANGNVGASKSCDVSVVLTPPHGYRLSVHPATYIGTVTQYTHKATLDAGHDWAGVSTAPYSALLPKPAFNVTNMKSTPFAACNQPSTLHDKITLTVSAGDLQGAQLSDARYTIQYQKCL